LLLGLQFTLLASVALAIAIDGSLPAGRVSPLRVLGVAIGVAGIVLDLWSARELGPALTASPLPRQGSDLVTTGPYGLARHPIYGGLILLSLGASLAFASWLGSLATALLVPLFFVKAAYEERHLLMRHAGYLAYRRRVRRRLIPYLI
jgi:protein-S-isoprenylcysteine O-methyltransferase Ste14